MGEVYKARDPRLDRFVAIKVLPAAFAQDPDRLARFERESKAVAALSHPNILSIFDVGTAEGRAYAVMELLDGESLRERLAQGPLSVRKATECAIQITRGLAAAHDKGLVHRDLKPDNIFLLRDGRIKILDFGLARTVAGPDRPTDSVTAEATILSPRTDPGSVMGTVGYMAPEQVRGQVVDGRSDLFAFGTVLYEMLDGKRAFERDTAADTMTAILKEDAPEFDRTRADIPPALDRIVRHCLEKNVVERFQSARDVAFALEALSGSAPVPQAIPDRVTPVPVKKSRRGLGAGLAALLVVAAAVGGGFAGRATAPRMPSAPRFTMKTFEPQTIINARFTPDGTGIVFSAALSGNAPRLFHIQAGLLEARPFGPTRTHLLSVSSKGELAVLTNANLIGQRLFKGTLSRMSIEGSPRPWMEDVREADWSPDGAALAIVHDVGSRDRLEYPIGSVLYETTGYVSDPRVSPDGSRVAFMDHQSRFDDRGWVKVVDRNKNVTSVAGEFWGEEGLAWSPDGQMVYFAANDRRNDVGNTAGALSYQIHFVTVAHPETSPGVFTTPGDFAIYDIAADGRWLAAREDIRLGIGVRLPDGTDRDLSWLAQSWTPRISQDGSRVLFSDGTVGANYGVAWRPTDGSPLVRLGEGNGISWSPDESWVLTQIFSPPQLLLYPMGPGEPVHLKRGAIAEYQTAYWFPDGKSLLVVANEPGKQTRAYRQQIPDGEPKPILDDGIFAAAITPDGKTVLAINHEHEWRWYPVDGSPSRPAAGIAPTEDPATSVVGWSTDGKAIYLRNRTDVPARIDRVDIATGARSMLAEVGPPDRTGIFIFTPTTMSRDGRQYAYSYSRRVSTLFVVEPVH